MLKISAFAKLAQTTRRTLILYDKQNVFKPEYVSPEGYRFYNYDQLYELSFILTLRKLGLSLDEIKQISSDSDKKSPNALLTNLQDRVDNQIHDLLAVKQSLSTRMAVINMETPIHRDQPYINEHQRQTFWQSATLHDCSRQQIAQAFAQFYKQLDPLVSINGKCSGFVLDLPDENAANFINAPFRLIKEATTPINTDLTTIDRPAGNYLAIDIDNDDTAIRNGIDLLHQYAISKHLSLCGPLWQINVNEDIRMAEATTAILRLEYLVSD
ncbi:MerR family transcriptional regulator [Companilactobacillus keshanensis]|uniref:MerR family transcriptional regulator n=1 Tax=Companilactobacillus keshanensis TaxID=2486003 RepID=A0ABW4BVG6_9LACO|nr:MerR family transcriptional regulator [Companilactobacillus keshanensis]